MQCRISVPVFLALGAVVLLPAWGGAANMAPTFGPKQYLRTSGAKQTFAETFPRCGGPPCQLVIENGNADGSNRVSAASISLNGVAIVKTSDLNQKVAKIVRPVSLSDDDRLSVELSSKPGSFLTVSVQCTSFAALHVAESPGVLSSTWPDSTVALSIPLENLGNTSAENVAITSIQAGRGNYDGPVDFSYPAGTIDPDETQPLNAQFTALDAQTAFPLTVSGTYNFGPSLCSFQAEASVSPPLPGNGGEPKRYTSVQTSTADTASYPAAPPPHPADDEPNAENQYIPPLGQPRYLFASPPAQSDLDESLAFTPDDQNPPASGDPSAVVFVRNTNGGNYSSLPPDPSVGGSTPGGFAMISANSGAAAVSYSTDYGATFKTVNLTQGTGFSDPSNSSRADFFPESDGGLCCDQVLHYVPGRNLMVWLLQYWSPAINVGGLPQKGQNRLRIAWATPEAAAADFLHAWRWFDVSPATLGDATATDWMDYPDLAYSNDWLYISVDHGFWNAAKNAAGNVIGQQVYGDRRWFVRASLTNMVDKASSVNLVYYEPIKNGVVKAHFAQSSPNTMYYGAQPDTSTLSVFADPDSAGDIPTPKDIPVSSYCNIASPTSPCDFSVMAPDGLNWNVAPHGVLGGAYVAPSVFCPPGGCNGPTRFVYFAFDGGRDAGYGRPFPYVRVEKVDADALGDANASGLVSELDIWNPDFAFATPGLTWRPGSAKDEVAFSLATGGGGGYADNAVGFLGDFEAYVTTSSDATQSDNKNNVRYGDYFNVRNSAGPITLAGQGVGYATHGYAVTQANAGKTCAVGGCYVALQYILFGRNSELFPSPRDPGPR